MDTKDPFHQFLISSYWSALLILLLLSLLIAKGNDVLLINGNHNDFTDIFFRFITNLGDGIIFLPIILGLLFIRFYYSLVGIAIWVSHGMFCALAKRVLFASAKRPKAILDNDLLYFVPNVDVHGAYSFPSGHTATIFGLAVFLSLLIKNRMVSILLLILALLVGYSRIYLLQHFLMDVVAGAFIGSGIAFLSWHLFEHANLPPWMSSSIRISFKMKQKERTKPTF
jgi:membrane-associated phospholipid phosphatase